MIELLIGVIVFCLILWVIQTYIPLPQPVKTIVIVVIAVIFIIWLLGYVGMFSGPGLHWHGRY